MTSYDVLVLGAGPAGLFTALKATEKLSNVLILEKMPAAGRKLLLTGSGQCNFTNIRPIREFLNAYGDHGTFLKPALYHYTNQDIIAFFRQQGVEVEVVSENGKVFPQSRQSKDILKVLLSACQKCSVEIRYRQKDIQLQPKPNHTFSVYSASKEYLAHNVVIATGGKSYPGTGSTGDGYILAQSVGHSVAPPRPGLTPFFIKNFSLAELTGISFKDLRVTLWHNGKKLRSSSGDLVLTHQGISGPVVHNLARFACSNDTVTLSFVAGENSETFKQECLSDMEKNGKLQVKTWLKKYQLPLALSHKIMTLAEVKSDGVLAQLSRKKRLSLLHLLTDFPLEIEALGDFSIAMVTCGGVALEEVNPKTMESRLVKGLYFVGEVLDVDGDSGGYDLQAAWSTAALAAHAMTMTGYF